MIKLKPEASPEVVDGPEEYECERGCGFDSLDMAVVEEHEKICTYELPAALPIDLTTAPNANPNQIMINDAVRVQWKFRKEASKQFQAVVVGSAKNKITIQFDGTWKKATVHPSQVEPLKEVPATELPQGHGIGDAVWAQDPFDEEPDRWHNAVILSVRHGTQVEPPNETICEEGKPEFRFWVRFEVDQEANCQWCGFENLRTTDPAKPQL